MESSSIKSQTSGEDLSPSPQLPQKIEPAELQYLIYCDLAAKQAHKEHQEIEKLHEESLQKMQAKTSAVQEYFTYLSSKYSLTEQHTITKTGEIVLNEV